MTVMQKIGLILILITVSLIGCAQVKRGMLNDQIYYSTYDPKIQLKISEDFEYHTGKYSSKKQEFVNAKDHKYIYIQYYPHMADESQVDYYENPINWIFNDLPNSKELNKGTSKIIDKTWYYRDSVWHISTAQCAIVRDVGLFTDYHSVLKILYVKELPPYECSQWKDLNGLNKLQETVIRNLASEFSNDVKITNLGKR